ncbi:MAG: HDIG domain-containing protein [Planctomycetota bacterium]|nr:MAG: HDIG domain-containing protein [Planctomycetota bacterium]
MSTTPGNRTRSQRAASLKFKEGGLRSHLARLLEGPGIARIGLAVLCCILFVLIFRGWEPPFAYREGDVPTRDIIARVPFTIIDEQQTQALRDKQRREVLCFYANDPQPIQRMADDVLAALRSMVEIQRIEDLPAESREWLEELHALASNSAGGAPQDLSETWRALRALLDRDDMQSSGKFALALQSTLEPISETGIISTLSHDSDQGSQRSIIVLPEEVVVDVARIRRSVVAENLPQALVQQVERAFSTPDVVPAAQMIGKYLAQRLPKTTLTYDRERSEQARRRAEATVPDAVVSYYPAVSRLAVAGQPLQRDKELPLLWKEHQAWLEVLSPTETLLHLVAFVGMIAALYLLCGLYIYFQYDRDVLTHLPQLARLLATLLIACWLCRLAAGLPLRGEILPLTVAALTLTIVYGRQMGLLLASCLSLMVTLGLGFNLAEFVTLAAGACSASLLLGRIRTRTRLMFVGVMVGAIVAATHAGVQTVMGLLHVVNPMQIEGGVLVTAWQSLLPHLLQQSVVLGGLAVVAAALMTGLLPFVERLFDVQTDLRLLELGDASHPLLRQLAQRAPGTYNHSINVAAIAEAAADAIGAHGLLTRVGAYFHDIGKMFKPNYFIENQEQGANCHAALQPAMSTLVIIAHVKDGADLARQHHLPRRIIDFIEQHHGTTLVEYFYRQATKQQEQDPNGEEVSETSFRYPGPKPRSLEAAVLMLADSVESASRALVEPTPSRIQHLVEEIAMKKLLDGQFDECGLTLNQLSIIKQSLVKSLTAIYHGRIKYPNQASA